MTVKIIVIGGGFGGLEAAFTLRGQLGNTAQITLIDRSRFHSFIPSLHEVSSGKVPARDIQIPFTTVLSPAGIVFIQDSVGNIDPDRQNIVVGDRVLNYDYLVVAAGASNNFFNIPGAEEHSYCFRSPEDAERIHTELEHILAEHRRAIHLVLAGGGTEGVEMAGEILDLIHDNGYLDDLAAERITLTVIERQSRVLPGFPQETSEFAGDYLRKRGVKIMAGQSINVVRKTSLTLGSDFDLPFTMLIWTGGIKPSRLIEQLPLPREKNGWLIVTDQLNSPADERVFGIGDVVSIHGDIGPLPLQRLAYHAQDQAVVAGLNIAYHAGGRDLIAYHPRIRPQMISIGREMGIYTHEDRLRTGAWVVVLKKAVERNYLMSCLSRPLLMKIPFRIPGYDLIKRLKLKLPF
jgi:NADH dehydrogenase